MSRSSRPGSANDTKAIDEHWMLFVIEGAALTVLGVVAVIVPSISSASLITALGWLFLLSGSIGLVTTFWARNAAGYVWSLISALLGIVVGVSLITQRTQDLFGAPLGWPLDKIGSLWLVLAFFFLVEGLVSVMYALDHRRRISGRWAWMLASGIIDIILAGVMILGVPGASAWTLGLLVAISMVSGGASLLAMGLHARPGKPTPA